MKTIQVSKKTLAMRVFGLTLAIVTLNAIPAAAQETPPRTLVKHVLNGTYYDAAGGTTASCGVQNCLATSNIYIESISCPGAIGVKCTYEVSIWAFNGLQSGVGLYQFLVDGGSPNGGGTDPSGFFSWGQGQQGGGLSVSSAYSVNSQVTNTSANQSHAILVNLGCDMGSTGCFVAMGSSTLTVRVLKP